MDPLMEECKPSATVGRIAVIRGQRPARQESNGFRLYSPLCQWQGLVEVNHHVLFEGAIQPGMLRLSGPDEQEQQVRSCSATAMLVELSRMQLFDLFSRFSYQHKPAQTLFIHPILTPSGTVQRLVREMKYASQLEGAAKRCFLNGLVEALIGILVDRHARLEKGKLSRELPTLTDRQLKQCCAYADERLHKKLSLKEWAGSVNLSVSDFSRRFQRKSAETPYAWFLRRRIERAKHFLSKTAMPISDLAYTLGFSSQSHFTQAFRVREGLSPARWRQHRY